MSVEFLSFPLTIISFNKKVSDIANFWRLPSEIKAEIQSADQIVVRGFQELYGLNKESTLVWSLAGHWTSRAESATFIAQSYGSKTTQWDGTTVRVACKHCGRF